MMHRFRKQTPWMPPRMFTAHCSQSGMTADVPNWLQLFQMDSGRSRLTAVNLERLTEVNLERLHAVIPNWLQLIWNDHDYSKTGCGHPDWLQSIWNNCGSSRLTAVNLERLTAVIPHLQQSFQSDCNQCRHIDCDRSRLTVVCPD